MKQKKLKVLIIRFSSIGDIVLTTPVIRCLKTQFPHHEVHYLTKSAFKPVLAANPYIDKLHLLHSDINQTIETLKEEKFNYVIDLHHNLRTLLIKARLRSRSASFKKLNFEKWVLVNFKRNIMPPMHIVDRYLQTVEFLGVQNDNKGLDYFLEKKYDLTDLLPSTHQHYIGLVIGAQHATKRLPQYKLIEICQKSSKPVVLLGGADDEERGNDIQNKSGTHVYNACGKLSLDESAYLVKMADMIISHDTGLMHIAAAFKKDIISVWGNTVPEFGMYPYQIEKNKIVEVKGLGCRPCSKIGYRKCPLSHFKCMNDINTDDVIDF